MHPVHFGRAVLLDQRGNPGSVPAPENKASRLVHGQLIRLGNNLNQMLRYLHRTGDPLPADLEPLLKDIRDIIARKLPR